MSLEREDPGALVFNANGVMLRVTEVSKFKPARYTVLGWRVPNILDAIRELKSKGVSMARFIGIQQDEHGVWSAPDGVKVAWFRDPDGNILSLTQFL